MKIVYLLFVLILLLVEAKKGDGELIEKDEDKLQTNVKETSHLLKRDTETRSNRNIEQGKIRKINKADQNTMKRKNPELTKTEKAKTKDEHKIQKINIKGNNDKKYKQTDKTKTKDKRKIRKTNIKANKGQKKNKPAQCKPSKKCRAANGKCISKEEECPGRTIAKGCRKLKSCRRSHVCCVPAEPVTRPVIPNTTPTPCPVPGKISTSILHWQFVGQDFFAGFNVLMNWNDARILCRSFGLDLYQPKDVMSVAKHLTDNFPKDSANIEEYFHIGAQGNGTHMVWLSGEVVGKDMPWQWSSYDSRETTACLSLTSYPEFIAQDGILSASQVSCNWIDAVNYPLCGEAPSYRLTWHTVGEDQFAAYNYMMNWYDSRAFCQLHGLDLYKPKSFTAVATYLDENLTNEPVGVSYWIGASGDGINQVWVSGGVLPNDSPAWGSLPSNFVGACTYIYASRFLAELNGKVLDTWNCVAPKSLPLCG